MTSLVRLARFYKDCAVGAPWIRFRTRILVLLLTAAAFWLLILLVL
jgi:hypothetical protein